MIEVKDFGCYLPFISLETNPKFVYFPTTAAGAYSINYNTDMLQKNYHADQTNPNVYHSIDENNEEHVYDEIKHKEGYQDPGKVLKF